MRRVFVPLSVFLLLGACSCVETRRAIVRAVDTGYSAPSGEGATATSEGAAPVKAPKIRLEGIAKGFAQITDLQWFPDEDERLVVLQKEGVAYEVRLKLDGAEWREEGRNKLFHVAVNAESEMGLLGWAFHPKFKENGRVFVNYTPAGERLFTRIEEWHYTPKTGDADPVAKATKVLLEVEQPYQNHNAGQLAFGPDGFLYIGFGDGGWRADPDENGQDNSELLGKMLRVDVDAEGEKGASYAIPDDNPFVDDPEARPEIWAYGIRNPWRYSFTSDGQMIVADVGQDKWEEVHLVDKGDNLGWKFREGRHCFEPASGCPTDGLNEPVFEYGREKGQSITGGFVYTGTRVPGLVGRYLVGDFVSGRMWALSFKGKDKLADAVELGAWPVLISTYGRNKSGEVFLGDFGAGVIYQIVSE